MFDRWRAVQLGINIEDEEVDASQYAGEQGCGLEAAARELRYQALAAMVRTWPGDLLLAGHTLDDQAETVLLHLLRGAGPDGIAAMRARRGTLVRPFLGTSRETIIPALEAAGDPSRVAAGKARRAFSRD